MHEFIAKPADKITGRLSGLDRLVFRGTLRSIAHDEGMKRYLWANQILLKDFGSHVEGVSRRLKEAALAEAQALGRPVKYLTDLPRAGARICPCNYLKSERLRADVENWLLSTTQRVGS